MLKLMIVTGVIAGFLAVAASPSLGSQIDDAVKKMDEGTVRITFAARDGVCGDGGNSVSFDSGNSWHIHHSSDTDWERDCDEGPVRVSIRVREGEAIRLKTRVGGIWRSAGEGVVDLGEVSPQEAVEFLLGVAEHSRRSVAEDAIMPAVIARDVETWPRILEIARNDDRPEDVREAAVFWLGQLAGDKAAEGLTSIVEDDDEDMEVREAAVFALSQMDNRESADSLMKIARSNRHPELRKSAMFWLAQSDDPEVLDFFEKILLGK